MAEEIRRSFDLKSWQGLTEVLKYARESSMEAESYAEFRNLVLQYAQQKGTDATLKQKIDTIVATLYSQKPSPQSEEVPREKKPMAHGRRLVPRFSLASRPKEKAAPAPEVPPHPIIKEERPTPTPSAPEVVPEVTVPVPEVPQEPPQHESATGSPKSMEEHRTRIMDIKRRVNALVGNPVTLMDHGNEIGREYMKNLLNALKATSPGSTLSVETAMEALESSFTTVMNVVSSPKTEGHKEEAITVAEVPHVPNPEPELRPEPIKEAIPEELNKAPVEPPISIPETPIETDTHTAEEKEEAPEVAPLEAGIVSNDLRREEPPVEIPDITQPVVERTDDVKEQIRALRERLAAREEEVVNVSSDDMDTADDRPEEIEEEPVEEPPQQEPVKVEPPAPPKPTPEPPKIIPKVESRSMFTQTPQAELMTQEVTAGVHQILKDWNIFASSGFLNMGPSGHEHPLYVKLSPLPMGEVLSGRFEKSDMKTVRIIKEYVNAWRHEQGVAYNPTETFEHYLRRVAFRILKRQKGTLAV